MAETSESLRRTQEPNPASLESLFHVLNPISFIRLHNSSPGNPIPLRLTTETYAEPRETKLRMKSGMMQQEKEEIELKQMPTKKQVKFSSSVGVSRKGSSILAQSVSNFSATLRKENQKPPVRSGMELTPPLASGYNWTKENGKKGRMMMLKKIVASVEDLKGISLASTNAINGENRGGKTSARGVAGNGNTIWV
ncbi:hypothetical protein E1A91_A07G197700v1 [Gossypium mustelinum]|uniref:Uncharacterized protein n=1 Tax=Gossypium mustelinum TaxID=34275 RepID=A0A5D2YMZ4_GOSMU|nr:hypothetical protein E1A91_A07G197700v1 [Gossypium mustelinum]